jgi:hypothetical protein
MSSTLALILLKIVYEMYLAEARGMPGEDMLLGHDPIWQKNALRILSWQSNFRYHS